MFVPESEKRKPEFNKFPTYEEFCAVLGLFENFEMLYDNDGDKMMVDFGNEYTKLGEQLFLFYFHMEITVYTFYISIQSN
jgi:hypothetical protein